MIRENNIKNRTISVFLVISMLVTNFLNIAMAYAETSEYEKNIGCTATFNTMSGVESYFITETEPDDSWGQDSLVYFPYEIPSDLILEIDAYKILTEKFEGFNENGGTELIERQSLWYKVKLYSGTMPEGISDGYWVMQNFLNEEDAYEYDSLIIETTEKDNITVIDEEGNEVGEEIELPQYEKKKITGVSSLSGDVDYQWQILIDDTWIDIYGEDEAEFLLSYGVVATVLDDFQAQIRPTTKKMSKVFEGESITVTIIPYEEDEFEKEETQKDETPTESEVCSEDEEFTKSTKEDNDSNYAKDLDNSKTKKVNEVKQTSDSEEDNKKKTNNSNEATTLPTGDIDNPKTESSLDKTETEETDETAKINSKEEESTDSPEIAPSTEEDETFLGALFSMFTMTAYAENDEENIPDETTDTDKVIVTIKYVYGANNAPVDSDTVYQIQKGADLSQELSLPVMEGYDAYLEDNTENIYKTYSVDLTNVTEDKVITFKYWPAKVNYTVIYYWQNAEDDNYTEYDRQSMTGFTGENTTVEEREYEGFYRLLYEKVPIASDGSTVIEVYYDRLYYKMIFNLDGGYGVQPIYARYGTPITVSNPTKAGYNFIGWDNITNGSGDGSADSIPNEVPPYHSEYKAIWEANDTAKVTVVYWGENADDEEYSYLSDYTQEIYAKPGTVINYGTDNLICSLDTHTHGDGNCSYSCNLEAHTHSENCYQLTCTQESHTHVDACYDCTYESHSHSKACYSNVGDSSSAGIGAPSNPVNGTIARRFLSTDGKVIYIDGTWYRYSGNVDVGGIETPTCGKAEISHTHTNDCLGCGKAAHTHTNYKGSCYMLSCTKTVHSHVADCYSCVQHTHGDNCYLKPSNIDLDLWTFVESDTVTVEADGSTVMNVYYDRVSYNVEFHKNQKCTNEYTNLRITAKWGENILDKWPTYDGSSSWYVKDKSDTWQNSIQVMPVGGAKFWGPKTGSGNYKATYYVEALPGDSDTIEHNGITYKYHHEDISVSSGNVTDEEKYDIEGFTYKEGTSNGSSYNGAKFYYTRNKYTLEFNNGEESVKKESVLYELPLSGYNFTPNMPSFYEPGSREFAGWYLNPECTGEEFVLSEHTMTADNLLLYAKWTPVTHTVRFYLDKNIDKTDANVYTAVVDGKTIRYMYDVPHGSAVQNPYTPPNDPEKGQYIFVGWFYEDVNGKEQMWDFDNSTVTRDVDIYAKWSSNSLVQYTVKFVYKDGEKEVEIAAPITGSALGGNSKTFEAKGNDQLYSNYQEGYFPTTQSHTIVMDLDNPDNNTYTFYYTKEKAVPYTVYFVTDKQNESNNLQDVELNGKTYYIVADTKVVAENKKAIVTETYAKVPGYLPDTYQQTLIINPKGDNRIIFYYTKDEINGMYVVHYLIENLDGTYTEHSIFEGRGKIGAEVNATIKDIENFTHDSSVNGTKLSGKISKDTVLELNVYYKRNQYSYKVQYLEQNTNKPLSMEKVEDALWQSTVTEKAIEIPNFTLVGNAEKSIQINNTVNIITFYYTENKVSLTIRKNGADEIDENQTFIFKVKGVAGTNTADIDMRVVVKGNGSVTIKDLPIGRYIVEEETSWSWRYEPNEQSYEVELKTNEKNEVPITNNRTKRNWLNGAAYCENLFTKKEEEAEK